MFQDISCYVLHQSASLYPLLFRIFVYNVHTYILHMCWSEFQDYLDFLLLNHTSHIKISQSEDSPNVLPWSLHLALWNHILHTYIWFLCMNVCFHFMCIFKPCFEFVVKVQFEHFNDFQIFPFLPSSILLKSLTTVFGSPWISPCNMPAICSAENSMSQKYKKWIW